MSVQQSGAHTENTGFVNRETVSCDDTVRSVSEFVNDADASSVGGTGGVGSVNGTQKFVGDISSYGSGSKSNWYKGNTIQGLTRSKVYVGRTPVTSVRTARQSEVTCDITS